MKREQDKTKEQLIKELAELRRASVEALEGERKRAEEEITRFKAIADTAPYGVAASTIKGDFIYVNNAFSRMHGYTVNELIGRNFSILYADEEFETMTTLRNTLIEDGTYYIKEWWRKRKDGTSFPALTYGHVVKDEDGNPLYVIGSVIDITERKEADETLQKRTHDLGERVKELNCLYSISSITEKQGVPLEEILQAIVTVIPLSWQYPEITCARIILNSQEFVTGNFRETAWKQTHDITVHHNRIGSVEIYYLEEKPESDEGPFLKEERNLIDAIAEQVGRITERKQAEERLKQSEENLRAYLESAPDGIYINDLKGTFLYGNKKAEEIMGYEKEELIGKSFLKLKILLARDLVKAGKLLALNAMGKPTGPDEFELVRKDGSHISVEINTTPIKQGREIVVIGLVRDITERKQAEKSLMESERKYRSAELVGSFGHYSRYLDTNRLVWSEGTYRLFGVDPNKWELTRDNATKMIHPQDLKKWAIANEEAERGDKDYNAEFRIIRPDGEERTLHSVANIILDDAGKPERIFGTVIDITERKKAEEEIKRNHDYLEKLNNSLPEVILNIKRPERTIEYVNQAVETEFGYSPGECIGRNVEFLFVDREEYLKAGKDIDDEFHHDNSSMNKEYQYKRKNGEIFPCEVTRAFVSEDEKISSAIGIITDITERKQAEERERQLLEELTMTSRLASVGEMAAGIAHEINNPLTGVLGFSSLLLQKDLPDDVRKDLNIIYEGARRVASITRRMLTFARQQKQEKASVDINDIIETTLEMRAYALDLSNINLVKQLEHDLPKITADAGQLQQVFLNIILNAETEMEANKGGNLLVKTGKVDDTIRISFKDDGSGIPKENLDKVFDPFFTTREVGRGVGLGLSVSHGIVSQHGGRIYAESQPGKGTTFVVELPIVIKDE